MSEAPRTDDAGCRLCHRSITQRFDSEPTDICDECAQEEIVRLERELAEARERERVAIASWDEGRERALREGNRVVQWRECARNMVDHARSLRAEWAWKLNSTASNNREMEQLDNDIAAFERLEKGAK